MGIQGLLPLLKSIMVPIHVKDLEGCSVAVDTYSWLHKGALSCSKDLCKGLPTSKHIDYCMHRVNLLRHHGVKPVLVFDGGLLPMKSEQENKRGRSRKENLARAVEHESSGNASAAYECYQKAVDISPSVAYELIQVLKQENVSYVVAPYEADAQMTFLAVSKQVDAVVTEDSDLIPFGCPRILYKMDKFGQGVEFRSSLLQHNKELNFTDFTSQMLLEMCILSGCDYLPSLPGMGLKKAYALIKKFKSYDKVIKHLKFSGVAVPVLYEESFKKAIMTFQHQRVFDPLSEDIVHLSEPSDSFDEDLDFLGPSIPQHIAKGIAVGDIDPLTMLPFQAECAREGLLLDRTYNLKSFKAGGERKKLDLPAQKNLLTNYFCFASLEAKRRFRAPRTSPKYPTLTRESLSPQIGVDVEAYDCNMNSSPASMSDSEILDITPKTKVSVDTIASGTGYVLLESPSHGLHENYLAGDTRSAKQSTQLIHPCIALQKARECSSASNSDNEKTRIETKNVIVRSSYFMNKSRKETGQEIGGKSTVLCEKPVSDTEHKSALDISDGIMRNNEVGISNMQYESMSPIEEIEGKRLVEKKKDIVSRYFKHRSIKENDKENNKENLHEDPSRMDDFTSAMKRKVDLSDTENVNHKYMRTSESSPIQNAGSSNVDLDPVIEPRAEEGKFGCNISHLGQYSDIAEKSIEKFVEVISSFRCNSSGSRASGLRAPLKDIRNTSTSRRSSDNKEMSKFSYVPTTRKAPPTARRR